MKSNLKKKTLSMLLAVCLVLILLPMTAFAAGETIAYPGTTLRTDPCGWGAADSSLFPDALSDNSVTVNGNVPGFVFGGVSDGTDAVTNNTVIVNSGTIDMSVLGGYSDGGDVDGNSVTVDGGTVYSDVRGGSTGNTGNATNNSVTINDGTVLGVVGGYSELGGAMGNSVTINGGQVDGFIYGGIGGPGGDAIYNTVTISGSPIFGATTELHGGGWGVDNFTGNTLNVWNYTGSPVDQVRNFEYYNFILPASLQGLQVTGGVWGPALTVTGVSVPVGVSLSVGQRIVLIEALGGGLPTGFEYDPVNTTVTSDGYTFAISIDATGYRLIATVTGAQTITWPNPPGNGVVLTDPWSNSALFPGISLSGNSVTVGGDLLAGYVYGGVTDGTGNVTDNSVIINSGAIGATGAGNDRDVSGGYSADGNSTGNTVALNGGTVSGNVIGGESGSGAATGNSVTLDIGTVTQSIIGGRGASANNNTVNITGGEVDGVYGGWSTDGAATNNYNTVIISGGKVNGNVNVGTTANAENNTLTIEGNPIFNSSTSSWYGGGGFTGNTLNVNGFSGRLWHIMEFETLNLKLPASVQNGDTLLTAGGNVVLSDNLGAPTRSSTVNVSIMGGGRPLAMGDTVTLIDAGALWVHAGLNTTTSSGGYTFALSVNGNKLIATVTAVPSTGGGGGGGTANPSGSFSDGSAYVKGAGTGLVFIIQKDFSQFSNVKVDNVTLTQGQDFTAENSSTKITLLPDYLDALQAGTHTLTVGFKDNTSASAQFTITQAVTPITPEMPVNPFTDVFGTDWFIDAVIYVNHNGLMTGTSTDPLLFSPNITLTRGMVVTVLWRMEGSPDERIPAAVGGGQFTDVVEEAYYYQAVNWAAANGIASGYGGGKFGPEDNITREQMAAILLNYELYADKIPLDILMDREFADWNTISDWAKNAVNRLTMQGIISGKPGNLFDPKGEATRAEFATVLMRFLEAINTD